MGGWERSNEHATKERASEAAREKPTTCTPPTSAPPPHSNRATKERPKGGWEHPEHERRRSERAGCAGNYFLLMRERAKNCRLAGRSARRRTKYPYQSSPYGM
jgi:hypothetical protein